MKISHKSSGHGTHVAVRIVFCDFYLFVANNVDPLRASLAPILEMNSISAGLPMAHPLQPTEFLDVKGLHQMTVGAFLKHFVW